MSYRAPFAPYGAHELKAKYRRNLCIGNLALVTPISIFVCLWIYFNPRPALVTLVLDRESGLVTRSTGRLLQMQGDVYSVLTGTSSEGPLDASRLKILPELIEPRGTGGPTVLTADRETWTQRELGSLGGVCAVGDYLDRITPIMAQQISPSSKPDSRPERQFSYSVHGIRNGTVHIPGDTVKGRLNFEFLEYDARRIELRDKDTVSVTAEIVISEEGRIIYFDAISEHPKGISKRVESALRVVNHHTSFIGSVPCPTFIKVKISICNECDSNDNIPIEVTVLSL